MSQDALLDDPRHPTGRRRTVPPHISDTLDLFAKSAESDDWESLWPDVERVANAILDATERVTAAEIRIALFEQGRITATNKLDALGTYGRKMGLKAIGAERSSDPRYAKYFPQAHLNRHTIFARHPAPLPDAVSRAMNPQRGSP